MERIDFKRDHAYIMTFLSRASNPYEEPTQYGIKQFHNYTVRLHKFGVIPKDDSNPAYEPVEKKFVVQATDLLYAELIARNVEPGCIVSVAMRSKPGDKTCTGPIWWEVKVSDRKADIQEEPPGTVDKLAGRDYCKLMKDIHSDLFGYFKQDAEQNNYPIDSAFTCINTVFMTVTKIGITEY